MKSKREQAAEELQKLVFDELQKLDRKLSKIAEERHICPMCLFRELAVQTTQWTGSMINDMIRARNEADDAKNAKDSAKPAKPKAKQKKAE